MLTVVDGRRFGSNYSSAHHDIFFVAVITVTVCLYFGFVLIAPSFKWTGRTAVAYLILTLNIFIGFVIFGKRLRPHVSVEDEFAGCRSVKLHV